MRLRRTRTVVTLRLVGGAAGAGHGGRASDADATGARHLDVAIGVPGRYAVCHAFVTPAEVAPTDTADEPAAEPEPAARVADL